MLTNTDIEKTTLMNTKRFWFLMWGLGIAGQLCWNIENQWFNTFVYAKIAKDSSIVTLMVITSALVTTFSTFIFGTISDRVGERRRFVSIGYIVWGLTTILFGLTEFVGSGQVGTGAKVSVWAAVLVILADDFMSFFGSMANDSGYNAWSNDMTNDKNRGQVGAVLAIMPVIGTIAGTVLGGLLIGTDNNYQRLFWCMGLFVIGTGLISLFLLKDSPGLKPHKAGSFARQFAAVFKAEGFFSHKELMLACITSSVFFISFNVYFVHMGNWMIYRMGFDAAKMGIIQGLSLLAASLSVIPASRLINKGYTPILAFCAILFNSLGLCVLALFINPSSVNQDAVFSLQNIPLFLSVFLAGAGQILVTQSMTMWVKELYPETSRGQFEGMRILFFVLTPMIIGTVIGNFLVKNGAGSVVNEFGITENIPVESIYVWGAVLALCAFIPLYFASKLYNKRKNNEPKDTESYEKK
ncbi:MFS transporter [Treponema putidum]|uniref:MFS transporter n=1 Tax=Treponema putidum TaxID=221027 RepID=A0AAE9SHR7_9SPIR|nr:MFS transporter [Treponema putidum]UTY33345.1 MFS transporter [Treponema putidum]